MGEGKNYCIFRSQKLKSVQTVNFRQNHNKKKFGPALGDDEKVVSIPLVIEGTPSQTHKGTKFSEYFKEVTAEQTVRKNAVIAFEAVLTFTHGAVPPERLKEWAEMNIKFLCEVYGAHNVFDVKLHLSERTPHIHAICSAIDSRGRLAGNNIIRGPSHMRKLQNRYAELMQPFGLERGREKPKGRKVRHKKVRDWYAEGNEAAARLQTYETIYGTEQEWTLSKQLEFNKIKADIINSEAPEVTSTQEIEK